MYCSVFFDTYENDHTVHGLKAASQSVLLFFMNILPLLKKAQKHENPSP